MLVIRRDLVEEMVAHARRDHPREACGQLVGPELSDRPERYVPMVNAALAADHIAADSLESDYTFDSAEAKRVHDDLAARDEETIVVFHSHTRVPRRPLTDTGRPEAYPSDKDIDAMEWHPGVDFPGHPGVHFVIVGLAGADAEPEVRSYRLAAGRAVVEDDVRVVESYMFSHTGADDRPDTV